MEGRLRREVETFASTVGTGLAPNIEIADRNQATAMLRFRNVCVLADLGVTGPPGIGYSCATHRANIGRGAHGVAASLIQPTLYVFTTTSSR